jgi:hypothetical protein
MEHGLVAPRKSTEFVQFKLRVREELRRRLERAAKKSDRSANNEAVARLEKSFYGEASVDEMLGGPKQAALLRLFASQLDLAKAKYGPGIELSDGEALIDLTGAIRDVLRQLLPTLHSVKIAMCDDNGAEIGSAISFTEKAWARMLREEELTKR